MSWTWTTVYVLSQPTFPIPLVEISSPTNFAAIGAEGWQVETEPVARDNNSDWKGPASSRKWTQVELV